LVTASVRAQAEGRRATSELGRGLLELKDILGPQSEIRINGNRMFAGGAHVDLPLAATLDRFAAQCREQGWQLTEPGPLVARRDEKVSSDTMMFFRAGDQKEGVVTCLLAPKHVNGSAELLKRLRAFAVGGDLGQLGDLRYAFARASAAGGTDVVNVWTEGAFDFKALIPSARDVPGREFRELPRPTGSRRVLDVEFGDAQYALKTYQVPYSVGAALDGCAASLAQRGWHEVSISKNEGERCFVKDGAALLLSARSEEGATRLNIVQIGSRGLSESPTK
jgi:hypothetical protein